MIKLTKTMMDKSIIDANASVRAFIEKETGFTYDTPNSRMIFDAKYSNGTDTVVRCYTTNRGDRRISFQNLSKHAKVGDTITLSVKKGKFYVQIKP